MTHEADAALRRYLPTDLAERMLAPAPRLLDQAEAFAHLVGTRYALSTYLPQHLVAHRISSADDGHWLEWVEGSLLFADVSGSTALAERLTSLGREGTEIVTATLNDFFATMIAVIQAAGGDLLTFGGDALLVLFSDADHPHTATNAALELLRRLDGFTRTVPGMGTFPLSMHIGVESGRVALVSAGFPDALRYSAMGATVNAVARAEGFGGRGELVVGPQTWQVIAKDAVGREVAEGFFLLTDLRASPAPPPLPDPLPTLGLADLPLLAAHAERLAPYLPANLVARIAFDPQRPTLEAELRPVTVLFAQILGLSQLVELLPPDQAAAVVDAVLRPFQTAIQHYGGFVNKLDLSDEGDKLLAIFGAPVAFEDHAERAARAALDMFAALVLLRQQLTSMLGDTLAANIPHDNPHWFDLRIGLNTGNVFAGNVGTAERKEYTVMGDAVNVAARVMAKAVWGEIWCSAATTQLIETRLQCEDRGAVPVKGKSEPLHLLRLLGERGDLGLSSAPQLPLIGRHAELQWLRDHADAALAGQGRMVRVHGEAGIGKSRLVQALHHEMHTRPIRHLLITCLSFATNTPFAPWADLLKILCGIAPGDSPIIRAMALAKALRQLGEEYSEWLPLLGELVGCPAEETPIIQALDPQQRQERRFSLISDLLRHQARLQPTLLLFENLQWADQISLDLWQYLSSRVDDLPLMVLGVHRGGLQWGSGQQGDGAIELRLDPLPEADCAALLDRWPDAQPLAAELRAALVRRADGNPLFLEELVRAVLAHPAAGSHEGLAELPDSLNGLLLARIDRLDERTRTLLRLAAVIGQRFPLSVLRALQPADDVALMRQVADLDDQELTLRERDEPERVHLFRHALLQEVAYQSLLYARRREIHRQIGDHLERRYADLVPQWRERFGIGDEAPRVQIGRNGALGRGSTRVNTGPLFLLAHHYRHSDRPDKAAIYLLLAGHAARETYANDEAIQHYRWALEALQQAPHPVREWETREALGDVLSTIGRYDEAQQEYAAILGEAADASQLPAAMAAEVLRSWGDTLEKQGRYEPALERLRHAESLCQQQIDAVPPLLLAAIYADMGLVLMRQGEYAQSLEICNAGLSKVRSDRRSIEDERIEADLHRQIGTIYGMRGDYAQARYHFENALELQEEINDFYGASRSLNNIGYLWQLQSDYARAVEYYERAETLAKRLQSLYMLCTVDLNLSFAYFRLDKYDQAHKTVDKALELSQIAGDQLGVAQSYDCFGQIARNQGRYKDSLHYLEKALEVYRSMGNNYQEGNTLAILATAHNDNEGYREALDCATRAHEISVQLEVPQLQVEALNAMADALYHQGEYDQARELVAQAAALADELGSKLDLGIARRLHGQIQFRCDQQFGEDFTASLQALEEINNRFELARTQARYGEALLTRNPEQARAYIEASRQTFIEIGAHGELRRIA